MAAMFPTTEAALTLTTLESVLTFSGVDPAVFDVVSVTLGRVTTIRVLAMLPPLRPPDGLCGGPCFRPGWGCCVRGGRGRGE